MTYRWVALSASARGLDERLALHAARPANGWVQLPGREGCAVDRARHLRDPTNHHCLHANGTLDTIVDLFSSMTDARTTYCHGLGVVNRLVAEVPPLIHAVRYAAAVDGSTGRLPRSLGSN